LEVERVQRDRSCQFPETHRHHGGRRPRPGAERGGHGHGRGAGNLGWEAVGIRDGFDGILHPERYPDGGLVALDPGLIANLDPNGAGILGQARASIRSTSGA